MKLTSEVLKNVLGYTLKPLEFDNLGKLQSKNGKKIISFLENERHIPTLLFNNSIYAVFTTKKIAKKLGRKKKVIPSNYPKFDFGRLHNYLVSQTDFYKIKIKWSSEISPHTTIETSSISDELVNIGPECKIEWGSVIHSNVKIGKNVRVSPFVVLGEEGEYYANKGDKILRFQFDGAVIIGDDVKIQSNVSIKKGLFGDSTTIGNACSIGSFVNIGHDVKLGKNCFLTPGSIIAGSCKIGDNCFFGVNSSVRNGITIGKNCIIGAGSVVTKNIPQNKVVMGVPAKVVKENS